MVRCKDSVASGLVSVASNLRHSSSGGSFLTASESRVGATLRSCCAKAGARLAKKPAKKLMTARTRGVNSSTLGSHRGKKVAIWSAEIAVDFGRHGRAFAAPSGLMPSCDRDLCRLRIEARDQNEMAARHLGFRGPAVERLEHRRQGCRAQGGVGFGHRMPGFGRPGAGFLG